MLGKFLNSKTKTVTFAALLLAIFAFFSRLLGLIRNNLIGNFFPKTQTDIYLAAFRIPDFVYGILITGGIIAAFLPVFASHFKKSKAEAQALTNNVFTFFLIALVSISAILAIFAPQLVKFVTPGFTSEQKVLTAALARIMFLSPILLGISAIFSGILHYFNLFFAYGLAPIFYNLGIIIGIIFLAPIFGLKGLAFGVILGAFLHLIIQAPPALKSGFLPRFSFNLKSPGLKKIFKLMVPRTLGSASHHLNLIVITAIASTLTSGSIMVFSFSNDLYSVPIGLIGISFATAVFPALSRNFANKERGRFFANFFSVFSQILFLIIPISVFAFLLRAQIVRLLYGTLIAGKGYFDWWATRLTTASLGVFSASLFAACLIPFLARAFFSFRDTKTPVKIAILAMALNIFLSFSFVRLLSSPNVFQQGLINFLKLKGIKDISVVGLPLAFSAAAIFQFFSLVFSLKRRISGLNFKRLYCSLAKILISTALAAILTYLTLQISSLALNTRTVLGLSLQAISAAMVGVLSYIFFSFLLKSKEAKVIWTSILAQFKK